jgi:hypothetical protein
MLGTKKTEDLHDFDANPLSRKGLELSEIWQMSDNFTSLGSVLISNSLKAIGSWKMNVHQTGCFELRCKLRELFVFLVHRVPTSCKLWLRNLERLSWPM